MPPNQAAQNTHPAPSNPLPPTNLTPPTAPAPSSNLASPADRQVRCPNPQCPSAKHGRPALICIIEAPPQISIAIRTRCRRCKSFQRIHLPQKHPP